MRQMARPWQRVILKQFLRTRIFFFWVCRQHVVVGGNDADVGAIHQLDDRFVVGGTGCQAMSKVAATELTAIHRLGRHSINIPPILIPQHSATSGDILGHAVNVWMHCVSLWFQM